MLRQTDVDALVGSRARLDSQKISGDGQFSPPAVDQNGELNPARSAKIVQRIQCSPCRATAVKHVIHQHNRSTGDIPGKVGGAHYEGSAGIQIIAVHRNIKGPVRHIPLPDLPQDKGQTTGEMNSAGLNAHDDNTVFITIALGDLVGHSGQSPSQAGRIEQHVTHSEKQTRGR